MNNDIVERLQRHNESLLLDNLDLRNQITGLRAEVAALKATNVRLQQALAADPLDQSMANEKLLEQLAEARADVEVLRANAEAYLASAEASYMAGAASRDAEVVALRVAAQMAVQAHEDGEDMQGAIDRLAQLLDAALSKEQP